MKMLSFMIKPASSLCNLRCKYCFYADVSSSRNIKSFGIMQDLLTEQILKRIEQALEPGDRVVFAFQGGEPTLAGLEYFEHFVSIVSKWDPRIHIEYALQTNATKIDEVWCHFLKKHDFLVGVSFDILKENHDAVRLDSTMVGTYEIVRNTMRLLDQYKVRFNVLCTLTNEIARHPQKVWRAIEKLNLKNVQFTPCLDELSECGKSVYALSSKRFASFYTQLFELWHEEFRKGNYRSIRLFDDLVHYLASGIPISCGINGFCQPQIVIEADGSVFPCDFFCLDDYKLGKLPKNSVAELLQSDTSRKFLETSSALHTHCESCPFKRLCAGGCKRMRREVYCADSDGICGYRVFLQACIDRLLQISKEERRFQN